MAELARTNYAPSRDDGHVAYQAFGAAGPVVLVMSGEHVPVDAMHEEPGFAAGLARLAGFAQVVCFDRRGTGLSDPLSAGVSATVEGWLEDALAVLDALDVRCVSVFAATDAGLVALMLAAAHPERVERMVLFNGYARGVSAPDFDLGRSSQSWEDVAQGTTNPSRAEPSVDLLALLAPSVQGDRRFRDWWDRAGHRGASPATALVWWRALAETDVRPVLSAVTCPTLVLHRADNGWTSADQGRYLAEQLPHATFRLLPGADDLWWVGDVDGLLDLVQEAFTGYRPVPEPDRVLATVLFTDLVGSTARAAAVGDRQWRDQLSRHNVVVRAELARYRGREIKTTGDGFLASFDGPARAIRCAAAIRAELQSLELDVRIGLHTGEVEVLGDDLGGIAVNIAARVMASAATGEVLVSHAAPPLVAGSGIGFTDRGKHALKGVPGAWRLFAVDD